MVGENLELREGKLGLGRFKPKRLEPFDLGCNSLLAGECHRLDNLLLRKVGGATFSLRFS